SAQRVFLWHSPSPIHWMDLSTIIESIVIYDNLAFPVVHNEYAAPLFEPLIKSGLADSWYPEAALVNGPMLGSKEEMWKDERKVPQDRYLRDAGGAIKVLAGWWPDANYESLSAVSKK